MRNISAFLICLPLFSYSFMRSHNKLSTRPKIEYRPLFSEFVGSKSLNDESIKDKNQIEAITSDASSILITAGAGTGKTRVLSARLAYLLTKGICNPREILILSSTNNAAHNLKTRADHLLSGTVATTTGVCCHTFHGFCSTVICKHYSDMLIQKQLIVADDNDQIDIMLRILNQTSTTTPNVLLASNLLKKIRYWKESGLIYSTIRKSTLKTGVERQAYEVFPEYQNQLKYVSALDYGDMLVMTLQLFRLNTQLLQHFRTKIKHILIDEFQDISPAQYDILRYLSIGPSTKRDKSQSVSRSTTITKQALVNVFCAGDDDQSIYSWRGANIALMRRFPYDFPQAITTNFDNSYRVPEAVGRAAQAVISNVNDRIMKSCDAFTMEDDDEKISIATGQRASLEVWRAMVVETEMNWLCTYIANITNAFEQPSGSSVSSSSSGSRNSNSNNNNNDNIRTVSTGDANSLRPGSPSAISTVSDKYRKYSIAVLVRTQQDLKRMADQLEEYNIPFRTRGYFTKLLPLFFGEEAGCILNLLRLLSFPHNDIAFQAALNNILTVRYTSNDIKSQILPTIRLFAEENQKSLLEATRECVLKEKLTPRYLHGMNDFLLQYFKWQEKVNHDYQKGLQGHLLLMDIMKEAYGARWYKDTMENIANEICESASHFDSLQQFITVIRQEGEYMINEATVNLPTKEDESGSSDDNNNSNNNHDDSGYLTKPVSTSQSSIVSRKWSSLTEHCRESFEMNGQESELLTNIDINREMPNMNVYRKMRSQSIPALSHSTNPIKPVINSKLNQRSSLGPSSSSSMSNSVSIWVMTMHAAKGLEFDEVLLPFWTDGNIPRLPSMEKTSTSSSSSSSSSSSYMEDERRLIYVALTRARDRVIITYSTKDKMVVTTSATTTDVAASSVDSKRNEVDNEKSIPKTTSMTLKRSPFVDDIVSSSNPKMKVRVINKESCIFPSRRSVTTTSNATDKLKSGKNNSTTKEIIN